MAPDFSANAPLVLVTVTLIARGVPGGASAGTGGRLDFPGALLAAVALSGSVFAVTEEPARGWSTLVVGSLAVGILGLIALAGIRNPRRTVAAELCPAGALCGASQELANTGQSRILDRGFVDRAVETPSRPVAR